MKKLLKKIIRLHELYDENGNVIQFQKNGTKSAIETFNIVMNPEILIKLDVQGYEDRVVSGGSRTLNMAKACIAEISLLDRLYEDQSDFRDIISRLYELGYDYACNLNQSYANDGHVIYIDAVFVKCGDQA